MDRLPQPDGVDHGGESAELVLLTDLVVLAQLATSTVEHIPGQAVAGLAPLELVVDGSAVRGIVAVVQDMEGLDHPPQLCQGPGQAGRVRSPLEGAQDGRRGDSAGLQGGGEPADLVPLAGDEGGVDPVAG